MSAFADKPSASKNISLAAPSMIWGNPEDVKSANVELLKNVTIIKAPEMIWGNPEDVFIPSPNTAVIASPDMTWGNPKDVFSPSIEDLKNLRYFPAPVLNLLEIAETDLLFIETLKQI